ncbi:hypothetical protein C8J56DRAFT_13940 [Mycena floridula]|nr:hypothetical protein C8J56DRAFT_13940 [Mycena floridula]
MSWNETMLLCTEGIKSFKVPASKRRLFATDLALVALSVRTAYLVDAVAFSRPLEIFGSLLSRLREKSALFHNVLYLWDPSSEQSFFINIRLLLHCWFGEGLSLSDRLRARIRFVLLSANDDPKLLTDPPTSVLVTLRNIGNHATPFPLTITLAPDLGPEVLIPLAAVLLEYPVALCIPDTVDDMSFFLARQPLNVYQATLRWPDTDEEHTLLKFSCPVAVAVDSDALIAALAAHFDGRLKHLGPHLDIEHKVETFDRVAL